VATTPLLEGIDGVEKMSKSKGNYIGITEPPKVMFRKVMQISDDLMWRYWELLTDKSLADIAAMKARSEPMATKMELARAIVADFHSAGDAAHAQADFDREVRQHDVPLDIETVRVLPGVGNNLAKLLVAAGLSASRTEAERLIKAGAIEIDGERSTELQFSPGSLPFTLRAGKKWKRIEA
jgi:tyrosyl-tRNA synthetase